MCGIIEKTEKGGRQNEKACRMDAVGQHWYNVTMNGSNFHAKL